MVIQFRYLLLLFCVCGWFTAQSQIEVYYGDTAYTLEGNLKDSLPDGCYIVFENKENYIIRQTGCYEKHLGQGLFTWYDSVGILTEVALYEQGIIKGDYSYGDDKLQNKSIYYGNHGDGEQVSFWHWHATGKLKKSGHQDGYIFNPNVGGYHEYYPNGQLKYEICYSCCRPDGAPDTSAICRKALYMKMVYDTTIWTITGAELFGNSFYENGTPESNWSYELVKNDTVFINKRFYASGKLQEVTRYNNALQLHGYKEFYNEKGILQKREHFINGVK
jgi:antitoxin component YwqK of YwqJK toxin-antitoxin module